MATANIESTNLQVVIEGNERVIHPRLADAEFFWNQDKSVRLDQRLGELENVLFMKSLGSMAEKAKRWAVLFSNQIGQKRIDLADKIADLLNENGKETIMIGSIHQSHEQLLGLGIDAAVITACPRLAIEDGPTWPMPLLTVPETQIVMGKREVEPYPFDEFA